MKKLLLIRHAKAAHSHSVTDFERPLKDSGVEDATMMAQRLQGHGIVPQYIVSSPAIRTLTTANIFSEHLAIHQVETNKNIYEASEGALLQIIDKFPDERDFVVLVGHNPGISDVLNYLTGESREMATCGIAFVNFEVDKWSEVSLSNGNLLLYDEP